MVPDVGSVPNGGVLSVSAQKTGGEERPLDPTTVLRPAPVFCIVIGGGIFLLMLIAPGWRRPPTSRSLLFTRATRRCPDSLVVLFIKLGEESDSTSAKKARASIFEDERRNCMELELFLPGSAGGSKKEKKMDYL